MGYVNYGSVTAVGVLFPTLSILTLVLRLNLLRRRDLRAERSDLISDVLLIPAVLLNVAGGVAMIVGAQMHFLGGHSPNTALEGFWSSYYARQIELEKFEYAFWIGDILAIGFTKLSILFFFRKIFRGHAYRTGFDWINWILIIIVALWMIAFTFANIFPCGTNFFAAWSTVYALRHDCVDTFALNLAGSASNWIMDVLILVEPLIMVSRLHMAFKRKLSVSAMFLLATFAVGAGLTRLIVISMVNAFDFTKPGGRLLGRPGYDDIGLVSILVFWTYIEMEVGCLVACLLPCRPYLRIFSESKLVTSLQSLLASRSTKRSVQKQKTTTNDRPSGEASDGSLWSDQNGNTMKSVSEVELMDIEDAHVKPGTMYNDVEHGRQYYRS